MFDLLLVTLTLTSPFLIIVLFRHYFKYKTQVNQTLAQLKTQVDNDTLLRSQTSMQESIAGMAQRIIILEKIVTDKNIDLDYEIKQL
jgi:hypothetical protein